MSVPESSGFATQIASDGDLGSSAILNVLLSMLTLHFRRLTGVRYNPYIEDDPQLLDRQTSLIVKTPIQSIH